MPRPKKEPDPPSRRPYGGWSIDERPERKAKPWRLRPPRSIDPKRTPTYYVTHNDAETALADYLERIAIPQPNGDGVLVEDYFDYWLTRAADSSDWAVNTIEAVRSYLKLLAPFYGHPLTFVTYARLQDRVAELRREGNRLYGREGQERHTKPLSARAVREAARTWERAFADAVRDKVLTENPAVNLRLPKVHQKDADVWSPVEVRALIRSSRGHRFEALIALVLGCGLRIGEALGLAWTDIDRASHTIMVRRSGTRATIQEHTKSRRARSIELPLLVWTALLRHHERQHAGAVYVFERPDGRRWSYPTVRRDLEKLAVKAGIPPYGFHAGRHAVSTWLLASGGDEAAVAKLLGHANPNITRQIYRHVFEQPTSLSALTDAMFADPDNKE